MRLCLRLQALQIMLADMRRWLTPGPKTLPRHFQAECDVPVPEIPGTGNFLSFFVTGKKYRYRKFFVTEKKVKSENAISN